MSFSILQLLSTVKPVLILFFTRVDSVIAWMLGNTKTAAWTEYGRNQPLCPPLKEGNGC
ncbi:hypothetical protein CLOSTMETH_00365 [[Clostridium] methylpentosum DSM 5476]|uniref:Uncharacterized protein n=1 Tax=[Clostridium] methylpentosum DSM 5476 TaxID=537013 RepID=C0E967_9FIRM|nr:hypothetical protein CLOSTMETH_00365 [[Clostridium] methylpentosum DSM 5476]